MALAWGWALAVPAGAQTPSAAARPPAHVTVSASGHDHRHLTQATVEAVRDSRVASQVTGRVLDVLVKAGDAVKAGQPLVRIDPALAQQEVSGSRAQLAQAQAQAAVALAERDRARQLFNQQFLSRAALDQAEARHRAADAQTQALQAQLGAANTQAGWHVVRAPFDGWVSQRSVNPGDVAGAGQTLMTVYDPSQLRLSAQVPASVVPRLVGGQAWTWQATHAVTTAGQGPLQVLPAVDPASQTVTVRAPLPSGATAGWRPGQSVTLALVLNADGGPTGGHWLPLAAVLRRGELQAVYVLNERDEPRLRQVRLGRQVGDRVEVRAGLQDGERVATHPLALVVPQWSNPAPKGHTP